MGRKNEAIKIACENRKARHDYFIHETYEAGMELKGTEVKSLRDGKANLKDSYAEIKKHCVGKYKAKEINEILKKVNALVSDLSDDGE